MTGGPLKCTHLFSNTPDHEPLESIGALACITKTRPCNILQFFTAVKMVIFR